MDNKFNVGDLVTFRTHPLLYNYYIKGDGKYVPPIMLVKEVFFENSKKKIFYEDSEYQIAEKIKYICVYFDDNTSSFIECYIYEEMLLNFDQLLIGKLEDNESKENYIDIISEILSYPKQPNYKYGKIVFFKTKKIEIFKKRISSKIEKTKNDVGFDIEIKEIIQYVVNYSTPEFIISGYKIQKYDDLHYPNGDDRRYISKELIKVKWFNPTKHKFSEEYLPIEFFTDIQPFDSEKEYM